MQEPIISCPYGGNFIQKPGCGCLPKRSCSYYNVEVTYEDCKHCFASGPAIPLQPLKNSQTQSSEPNLAQKGINFLGALVEHAKDGFKEVPTEIVIERLSVCGTCPIRSRDDRWVCTHKECGCFLKEKAKWRSESCPIHKWRDVRD